MTRKLRVAAEATSEARDASGWYENRTPGVGAAFLDAVVAALYDVVDWPGAETIIDDVVASAAVRRVPLTRFPYHLVYTFTDSDVFVLAVAHDHREPGYWVERSAE